MFDHLSVKDMLVVVTAQIDQAQALIDETRSMFKNNSVIQQQLDDKQFELDDKREQVKFMQSVEDFS
jgi:hypothetical protein